MTEKELKLVIEIIERNMTISHDNPNAPRIVLTQQGLHNVKKEIKDSLVKEVK